MSNKLHFSKRQDAKINDNQHQKVKVTDVNCTIFMACKATVLNCIGQSSQTCVQHLSLVVLILNVALQLPKC